MGYKKSVKQYILNENSEYKMKVTLVNFADKKFRRNQKWSSFTARYIGKIDRVIQYSPENIDNSYVELNKESVKYSAKGLGNYFWKPYVVNEAIKKVDDGDYLFYSDSGTIFLKSVHPLINHMEKQQKNIMCFRLPLIEKQWTKRDAFLLMDCDTPEYSDSCQILATYFVVKKCEESIRFLNDYMNYASDSRILSDDENVLGMPNYSEFIEHRHDQSILSLLSKKHKNVLIEGDISDYGRFPYKYLHKSNYLYDEEIIQHPDKNIFKGTILSNRSVNPLVYIAKYCVRFFLYKIGKKI